jgi:type VI secretion system protein ImpH
VSDTSLDRLLQAVQDEPWAHDFFALLRRIDSLRPDMPRTGEAARPQQDALRLAHPPELDFAPASLSRLELRSEPAPRLSVRFFGLLGPHGPMPLHFTEYLRERVHHHGDSAGTHFLDIFHHRMLSLFYRAWAQAQPTVHSDRPRDDRFIAWLGAVAGLPARTAVPREAVAHHAGLLSARSHSPETVCKVLRHYFDVPVQLQQHIGQWIAVDKSDGSRLGFARNRAERSRAPGAVLGRSANAGSRLWDRQSRVRLHLGPLTQVQHDAFLPGGNAWAPLKSWVGLLTPPQMQWELELSLRNEQRPPPSLGTHMRLGVTSWLAGKKEPDKLHRLRLRPTTSFLVRRASMGA